MNGQLMSVTVFITAAYHIVLHQFLFFHFPHDVMQHYFKNSHDRRNCDHYKVTKLKKLNLHFRLNVFVCLIHDIVSN